jgi:hypothetical protein
MFARPIQLFSDFLFAVAPTASSPALAGDEVDSDPQVFGEAPISYTSRPISQNAKDAPAHQPAELHARTLRSSGIISRRFIATGYRIHSQTALSFCRELSDDLPRRCLSSPERNPSNPAQQEQRSSQ